MRVLSIINNKLKELFSLDLRALALFRVSLAVILIVDLINRGRFLRAHYTDWGVLPRSVLIEKFLNKSHLSLHLMNGTYEVQLALFIIAGLFALALLLGFRTRLVTVVSWILLVSLQGRNPMVLQGGDVLMRILLFWAIFLPTGARFSIDSALNSIDRRIPSRFLSVGTVALIAQLCSIYWVAASLKNHPRWWSEGSAVYYALNVDQFATRFGHFMLQFPELLKAMTFITIYLEAFGPFLILFPFFNGPIRTLGVFLFMGMHAGFIVHMELGLFAYTSIVGWFAILPTWFWDKISKPFYTVRRMGLRIYYDGECGFCKKSVLIIRAFFLLPDTPVLPTQSDASIQKDMEERNSWVVVDHEAGRHYGFEAVAYICRVSPLLWPLYPIFSFAPIAWVGEWCYQRIANSRRLFSRLMTPLVYRPNKIKLGKAMSIIALVFLIYAMMWNIRSANFKEVVKVFPRSLNWIGYTLRLDQFWNMFAPFPLTDDGWFVVIGKQRNGHEIDLFRGGKRITWEKPELVAQTYPNQRWRKYMMNIWQKKHSRHREHYADYLCREWNERHNYYNMVNEIEIYFMREDTPRPGRKAKLPSKVFLSRHNCFKSPRTSLTEKLKKKYQEQYKRVREKIPKLKPEAIDTSKDGG